MEEERCIWEFSVFICSASLAGVQYLPGVYYVLVACSLLRWIMTLFLRSSSISKKKKYSMNKLIVVNSWLWPSSTGKFIDELIQMKFYWCNCSRKKVLQVLGISKPCESFLTLRSQRIWGSRMKNIPLLNFCHFHTTNCNNKFYICKNIWASLNQLPASACCYYICNGQEWAIEKVPGVQLMRLTDCVIVITHQPPSW